MLRPNMDEARELPLDEQELNDARALLDNEHFWDMVAEHWGGPAKELGSRLFATIDAFLAQPEPAAREAVLVEAMEKAIVEIGSTGDAATEWAAIRTLNRALADTSPAAAALLAQGEALREALEPFAFCQNVQHKPAEYVTYDMAIDAGEPTMEGTLLRGELSEPCGDCDGCRALAALAPGAE